MFLPPTFPPFFSDLRENINFYNVEDLQSGAISLGYLNWFNKNITATIDEFIVIPSYDATIFTLHEDVT